MTSLEKKIQDNTCECDICLKLWDDNGNKPTEYVKTKRGSELFFHTACLESLKRTNKKFLEEGNVWPQ